MALSIQQETSYGGKNLWKWSLWLEGTAEELDGIDHVMYILDSTFHNPVRAVSDRGAKFRLDESSWGKFTLYAKAVHKDGGETTPQHELVLLYPDGTPTLV